MREVLIVPTGTANLASVASALRRVGLSPRFAEGPDEVDTAARVLLPGVGALGAAMAELTQQGFVAPLSRYLDGDRPFLSICLGLQLLAETSEESPGVRGLGRFPVEVTRLRGDGLRIPHIGWNRVDADASAKVLQSGDAYFANSYRMERIPEGCVGATALHGERFVAAIERGPLVACQFHPELSGAYGLELLTRWGAL
ncbi:MAG: imidazole glycerol phosphate synthase subunit HisH [Myxococcota bacterium]